MHPVDRIRRGPDPAAVLSLTHGGNECLGEAARIRMEDLPSIVDIATGRRHNLNVQAQEGLSEEIHFLYDDGVDIIAIQRKLHLRASALERLLADLANVHLEFQIVLREDALRRFQRMGLVKKIYFKLARPNDIDSQRRPALRRVFREMDEFNGVSAKVEISIGRHRDRGLRLRAIREVIEAFRESSDDFRALSITGAIGEEGEPEERSETIDFIKGRLRHVEDVPRAGRRLDAERCRLALRRAIRENRAYLQRYMG
jgi:hypothetical protein